MRHGKKVPKLGRTSAHRKALLRNMATSLILKEKITTTVDKAKALRPFVEKIITRGKADTLHNKREVLRRLTEKRAVFKLFSDIGPRFASRPGGYTRMFKLGTRPGDAAEMVLIELVEEEVAAGTKKKAAKPAAKKAPAKPAVEAPKAAAGQEAAAPEAAPKVDAPDTKEE